MDIPLVDRVLTPFERKKLFKRSHVDKAHPAKPGSGPDGETCKSCRHIHRSEMAKTYLKCWLMRAQWTGGPGTDIRARDPACSKWEARS
jgi:hypothetical protein